MVAQKFDSLTPFNDSSFSSDYWPLLATNRGAYFNGNAYLKWDSFVPTSKFYIGVWFRTDDNSFDPEFIFSYDYAAYTVNWERHDCNEGNDNDVWIYNKTRDYYVKHRQCWEIAEGDVYLHWHYYTAWVDFTILSNSSSDVQSEIWLDSIDGF
jgi:hypothetical protein